MEPVLVLDCNYIAHRQMYKVGFLSNDNQYVGVIFGFLNSLLGLAKRFEPEEIAFCWDSRLSIRKRLYPEYKQTASRLRELSPEEAEMREAGFCQFDQLREYILPNLGFANVFMIEGLEADDLIASIALENHNNGNSSIIIVSGDNDLWQLLRFVTGMYNPDKKALINENYLLEDKGVSPSEWLEAKTIAGDLSDNIKGVPGFGIKTAIKKIKGEKVGPTLCQRIIDFEMEILRNRKLMRLPHPSTPVIRLQKSHFNLDNFEHLCQEFYLSHFLKPVIFNEWKSLFGGKT